MGAKHSRHRVCPNRRQRPESCAAGQHGASPDRKLEAVGSGSVADPSGRVARWCIVSPTQWRDRRLGHGRSGRHRAKRLGPLSGHRCGPFDEHFRSSCDHVRLAGFAGRVLGLASVGALGICRSLALARPSGGGDGRAGAGRFLCLVQRLGGTRAAHDVDVGGDGAAQIVGPALAWALGLGFGRGGGADMGPVGHVAAGLLAQFCGCWDFDGDWPCMGAG